MGRLVRYKDCCPPRRRYYVTTPDGDMSCRVGFGARRSTVDSGESLRATESGSGSKCTLEQARDLSVSSAVAGFVSSLKFQSDM